MYNYVKTIELLIRALETKGKYYNITSKRYKVVTEDGKVGYRKKFKYVDIDNKDNFIESHKNPEILEFLLKEWEPYKDK